MTFSQGETVNSFKCFIETKQDSSIDPLLSHIGPELGVIFCICLSYKKFLPKNVHKSTQFFEKTNHGFVEFNSKMPV